MKQITMDFDRYETELILARAAGFSVLPDLKEKLTKYIQAIEDRDHAAYTTAKHALCQILVDLEKVLK